MNYHEGWGRRDVLRGAGLLGLGGLGLAGGLGARSRVARAADAEPLKIVDLEGSLTPVFDELIKEGQYFQQVGLNATISNVTDGSKIIAALISGNGDLCTGSGFSGVFPAIEKGAQIKIVSGATLRPQDAIYTKRPDILSCKDLIGKTVGTGPIGALLHELAVAVMVKQGVDYTKVKFVNVGTVVNTFKAVVAGTVDAGFGSIDVYDQQAKYGVHVLSDAKLWEQLPDFTNQAMIASDRAIGEKRDLLVKALAAHAKLYRFIESPNSADAWAKARIAGLHDDDRSVSDSQWKFFNSPGMLASGLVLAPQQFEFVQQLNVKLGVQSKVLPFEQVADMSIAQDALKLLG